MSLPPTLLVARESLRALAQGALLLPRGVGYLARREQHRKEVCRALEAACPGLELPPPAPLPRRLSVFLSAAERSGEIHAVNLARELRSAARQRGVEQLELVGLGGRALAEAGVQLIGTPVDRAQMGLSGISASLSYWLGLVRKVAAEWQARPPHVFVPVDSPALHVPLARIAKGEGARVVHFVAPQYWGWAPWRVGAYRRCIDRALTILPFEPDWYTAHGVRHAHVGHPLLDEIAAVPGTRAKDNTGLLVLLPGSRRSVIERNLPWMLARARCLPARETAVLVPDQAAAEQCERITGQNASTVGIVQGRLHEHLARAQLAFSVSGTILTDVLHHRLPCVVLYRMGSAREAFLSRHFLTVPWFASINLLANREVLPEFGFHGVGPVSACEEALQRLWSNPKARADVIAGLDRAAERLGPPGACARAAQWVLNEAADAPREGPRARTRDVFS
jgi:lipid-A-disaccharide synthase